MQIIVSGKKLELTPSLRTYVEEKLGKIERYWADIIRLHAELDKNQHHKHGNVFSISVWVEAPGNDIRAREEASEMHEAIDLMAAKLERLVTKAKERRRRI